MSVFLYLNFWRTDTSLFVGPLIPLFWTSGDVSSGFQSQSGQHYLHLAEAYVLHVSWDSPLVWHLPTSRQPVWQLSRSLPHMQSVFIRLVACVGSGDPVRVLRLYTMNTLDEVCSIYCWDICTTCRYRSTCYSTGASGPTALSVCSRLCLVTNCSTENWALVLYCTMPFIATCVDAIGTVFWDRPHTCICGAQNHGYL